METNKTLLDISITEIIHSIDTTPTKKHVKFFKKMINLHLQENSQKKPSIVLIELITSETNPLFTELVQFVDNIEKKRIKHTDTQKYYCLKQIFNENQEVRDRNAQQIRGYEVNQIFENNYFNVIEPLTFESARRYGYGTRWCVTQDHRTFEDYVRYDQKLIYILKKGDNQKVAVHFSKYGEITYWNNADERYHKEWFMERGILNGEVLFMVEDFLRNHKQNIGRNQYNGMIDRGRDTDERMSRLMMMNRYHREETPWELGDEIRPFVDSKPKSKIMELDTLKLKKMFKF